MHPDEPNPSGSELDQLNFDHHREERHRLKERLTRTTSGVPAPTAPTEPAIVVGAMPNRSAPRTRHDLRIPDLERPERPRK